MTFQQLAPCIAILASLTGGEARADALPAPPPIFTSAQMRADLAQLRQALWEMPADLAHSVEPAKLDAALNTLDAKLEKSVPLTRDGAWREFATLNPLLADGHLFVGFTDWRGDVRAHLASGGTLFPWQIDVSPDCELTVHQDALSSYLPPHVNARLRGVNGVEAHDMCEQLMARVHGDTRTFRADLLSRRFWFFHWKVFGAPGGYAISLAPALGTPPKPKVDLGFNTVAGSSAVPGLLAAEEEFRRQFNLQMIADDSSGKTASTAVLRLGTFAWPDKGEVLAFTRKSFESLKRSKAKTLIIDLSDNGGGNDDQWIEGVMPYLATKRWRTASSYRKRVVTPDPAKGEKAGDVVDGQMETWYDPQPDHPLRFGGDVQILVGPGTYSSRHGVPGLWLRQDRWRGQQRAGQSKRRDTAGDPDSHRPGARVAALRADPPVRRA